MDKLKKIIEIIDKLNIRDLKIYQTNTVTPFFDYIIIATVSSQRQLNATAFHLKQDGSEKGLEVKGVEGSNSSDWVLVDMGDILVNVFTSESRDFYGLDNLWKNLPEINL